MNELSDILPAGIAAAPQSDAKAVRDALGQEEFLQLLTAQLQNQDPLKPMESGDFLGQIAQFGTVSGIGDLKTSFNDLSATLQSSQALQASTMVGRHVLVAGDTALLENGQGLSGAVALDAPVSNLVINIVDPTGQAVRRIDLGTHSGDIAEFTWDGLTDGGHAASPGIYRIEAEGIAGGQNVALDTLIKARVDSVTLQSGGRGPQLNLNGLGTVSLSQIQSVS